MPAAAARRADLAAVPDAARPGLRELRLLGNGGACRRARQAAYYNRQIEDAVSDLGGHKGLYSTSFYSPEEFWERYNGTAYAELKRDYDASGRLADLYSKCVRGL